MEYLPHKGKSMWPLLTDGDEIGFHFYDQPRYIEQCEVGQVVLHREENEWVAHRVIKLNGEKALKGDFSNSVFQSKKSVVWGEADKKFKSSLIAKLSKKTCQKNRLFRKFYKFLIFTIALKKRLLS